MVTERVPGCRTVSLGCFVGVGSRDETPARHGASHFLEHVLFKGTRRRTAEQISAAVEAVGGDLNAYTAKEHTCFHARVIDEHAGLAVDVLTDMLTASLVRGADLETERAVILDEIAMHADDPAEVAHELASRQVFGPAGLGQPVIGSAASIRALSRAQVVGHWRRHYRPDAVVVAAAGNIDHDWLVGELAGLAAGSEPTRARAPATATTRRRRRTAGPAGGLETLHRRVEQVTAILSYPGLGLFDERRYPLGLLSLIIGGGMASRLFVEIRERRALTYGIDAGETAYTDAGIWSVDWQCAPERLAEIGTRVAGILQEVAADGVTDAELARAQGQMRGQTVLSYESPFARMGRLGSGALVGDERSLPDLLAGYDAVTVADVHAEARRLFGQVPSLAVVGPRLPAGTRQTLHRVVGG